MYPFTDNQYKLSEAAMDAWSLNKEHGETK
jgi:hypothetical protein